ncbi:hypothetical protein HDU96_003319, partial [Phlyctochytrium bullatum]
MDTTSTATDPATASKTTSANPSTALNETLSKAAHEVLKTLHNIPIASLLNHRKHRRQQQQASPQLVAVPAEEPVRSVLQILAFNDILAVPVYRLMPEPKDGKEFMGIVSVFDICAWTVFQKVFDKMEKAGEKSQLAFFERWSEIEEEMDVYFNTPISEIIGYTAESSVSWTLHSTDPMSSLLQMLLNYHRILIIDDEAIVASALAENPDPIPGSSVVMVTQMDLVAWLLDNRDVVAPHASTTVFSTPVYEVSERVKKIHPRDDPNQPLGSNRASGRGVVTVPDTFTAIQAFRVMYLHRVTAVAVVDGNGGLVANLSASDLRGITADKESLGALLLPVFTFLEAHTHRTPQQIKGDQIRVVKPSETLSTAVKCMVRDRIHRVWVQGAHDKPIGVVTLTDVVSAFIPENEVAQELLTMEHASPTPVWGRQFPGEGFDHRFTEEPSWPKCLGANTMFYVVLISLILHFVQWRSSLASDKCVREETARANAECLRADAERDRAEAAIAETSNMSESTKRKVRNATNSLQDALKREGCLKVDLSVSKTLAERRLDDYNELAERFVLQSQRESLLHSRIDELQKKNLSFENDVALAQEVNVSTLEELESSQADTEAARRMHERELRNYKAKAQLEKYELLAPVLETRERGRKCGKEAAQKAIARPGNSIEIEVDQHEDQKFLANLLLTMARGRKCAKEAALKAIALPQLLESNQDFADANTQTASHVCELQKTTDECQTDPSFTELLEERDVNICKLKVALSRAAITEELLKADASDKIANLEAQGKNFENALESSRVDNEKLTAQSNSEIEARTEETLNAISTSKQLENLKSLNVDLQEKLAISSNALKAIFGDAGTQTLSCDLQMATVECQTDSSFTKLLEEISLTKRQIANQEAHGKNLEHALESSRADNEKLTAQLKIEIEARTEVTSAALSTSKQLENLNSLNANLQEKLTISNEALAAAKQTAFETKCQTDSSFTKLLEEISSTKPKIASMEIAGKNLERALESSRMDNEKLTAELISATLAAMSTSKQLETLNGLNLDLQEKLTISNNSLAVAKQTESSIAGELLAARAEMATTRQAYESRISGQEVSLQQARDIINKLNLDNVSLRESTSALQEDLTVTKQSADRFAGETSMLRDQLAATAQALNLKSQEVGDAGKTVEMLKTRISIIEEELRAAMDGNLTLKNAAEQARLDKQRAQEEVDRARVEAQQEYLSQIQQREAQLSRATQEVEALRHQLAGTESQMETLQSEINRCFERAEREVADLAEKLLAAEGENADYQEELEEARDSERAWRKNYMEARQKLEEIEKELQVVKGDRDGLKKQCMDLEDFADDLELKMSSLRTKVANLQSKNACLEAECDELCRERNELDDLVDLVQSENEAYRKTVARLEGKQNLKASKFVPKGGTGTMPGGPTPSPEPQNGSGSAASISKPGL